MPTSEGSEVKKPSGIIYPPPDLRTIVDKMAEFVAKNGKAFEKTVLQKEANNLKFQFLFENNPYHGYYQYRVGEYVKGHQDDKEIVTSGVKPRVDEKKATVEAKAVQRERPPPYRFLAPPLRDISTMELDLMKLTARYVARNGRQFLDMLSGREARNPQFDFLRPYSPHFFAFQKLVDGYSSVIMQPDEMKKDLEMSLRESIKLLDRCHVRSEYEIIEEERKKQEEAAEDRERLQYSMIDWHSFVVVETIDFFDGEELPPPMLVTPTGLVSAAALEAETTEPMPPVPTAWSTDGKTPVSTAPSSYSTNALTADSDLNVSSVQVSAPLVKETAPIPEEKIVIRSDYKPMARKMTSEAAHATFKDPITGQIVDPDKASDHLRIELIDPRYAEYKAKEKEKFRETNLATNEEMVASLTSFASSRTDIFGEEDELSEKPKESKKKDELIWDGHVLSKKFMYALADEERQRLEQSSSTDGSEPPSKRQKN